MNGIAAADIDVGEGIHHVRQSRGTSGHTSNASSKRYVAFSILRQIDSRCTRCSSLGATVDQSSSNGLNAGHYDVRMLRLDQVIDAKFELASIRLVVANGQSGG